jgi:LytS/YehU family sensor histidine kinase
MLRYQLYECATDQVPLEKEINYIHNFIDLQKLRTNERLKVTFNTGQVNAALSVPPLLLAPLVENAFKHISKFANAENWIVVTLRVVHDKIHFTIQNSVETVPWSDPSPHRNGATAQHEERGIGLTNIQRRLRLIYGDKADLKIEAKSTVFTVTLLLPTT